MLSEIEFDCGCIIDFQYSVQIDHNVKWSLGKFEIHSQCMILKMLRYAPIKHYLYALTWKQISS